MLKRIKNLQLHLMLIYILTGIVVSVIIYMLITTGLTTRKFDLNFLEHTSAIIVGCILGCFAGGWVFVLMLATDKKMEQRQQITWENVNTKGNIFLYRMYLIGFTVGGFSYAVAKPLLNIIESENGSYSSLYSYENITNYIGSAIAFGIFSLFFTYGSLKRLKKIYQVN